MIRDGLSPDQISTVQDMFGREAGVATADAVRENVVGDRTVYFSAEGTAAMGVIGGEFEKGVALDGATGERFQFENSTATVVPIGEDPDVAYGGGGVNMNIGMVRSRADLTSETINYSADIGIASASIKQDAATGDIIGLELGIGLGAGAGATVTQGRELSSTCLEAEKCGN